MLKKIRTSIIALLTIINFIGIILLFSSILNYNEKRISKREISDGLQKFPIYFNKKQIQILQVNNTNYTKEAKLKNLSNKKPSLISYYFDFTIIFVLLYLYFCMTLIFSFMVQESECNNCCCGCCKNDCSSVDCNCNCGNGDRGILFFLIIIFIIILIYYSTKIVGKHLSRYISLSFISIINFFIIITSLISLVYDDQASIKYNLFISSILFLCNIMGIILPNLNICKNLRYKENLHYEINIFFIS